MWTCGEKKKNLYLYIAKLKNEKEINRFLYYVLDIF